MIKLRIPLAGAFCFTLLSCQVGVGTPGEYARTPENCQQISPNQLTGPNIEPPTTTSNASIVDNANSPVKILNLLAPDNFQIAEQTAQTLRVKWDIKEKTPHSYTLHLNGKTVAEGVNLATYTFTNLKTNEDYEIAIEAVNANGKSSLIKLSSFDGLKEKTDSGSTDSGSKCPKGSLISVCVGVGGIGGLGLGI